MSCGHISSGWETRVLRRFSWALATNSTPFGPWLRIVWEALPQNINLAWELWFVIWGNLGDYQAHKLIFFHLVLWNSPRQNEWTSHESWAIMSLLQKDTHILNSYKSASIHAITLDGLFDLREAQILVFFLNILVKSQAVSNTNRPLTLCRVTARSLLALIHTPTHTPTHRRLWTQSRLQWSSL